MYYLLHVYPINYSSNIQTQVTNILPAMYCVMRKL